ncbi:MAG: GNAT family N-acetyltransferase [Kiritimatiellae bacterium]|nr:GNAT family N-acetyltransferase [Kiritimatiellia bacterium]
MITVRKAKMEEAQKIMDLHCDTVQRVNSRDYTEEQIKAWLGVRKIEITQGMIRDGQFYVAVDDTDRVLGIGSIKGNVLFGLYVSADHQGEGIGTALLDQMEKDAARVGITQIETESTLTAEGFYKRHRYGEVERKTVTIARGQSLKVVFLKKVLL